MVPCQSWRPGGLWVKGTWKRGSESPSQNGIFRGKWLGARFGVEMPTCPVPPHSTVQAGGGAAPEALGPVGVFLSVGSPHVPSC